MLTNSFVDIKTVRKVDELLQAEFGIDHFDDMESFFNRHKPLKKRIDEYFKLVERAAARSEKLGTPPDETAIMKKLADFKLNGAIGSMTRRHFYLDAICFISSVIESEDISGTVIDIGCHNGVIPLILSNIHDNQFVGCDPCYPAISSAQRHRLFNNKIEFNKYHLPNTPLTSGDLVFCLDVLHHLPDEMIPQSIRQLCQLVNDSGFLILTTQLFAENEWLDKFNSIFEEEGLGFLSADVIGGYGKCPPEFEANPMCLFIKKGYAAIPPNLDELVENDWNEFFKSYSNDPTTLTREKTQSFERSRRHPQI